MSKSSVVLPNQPAPSGGGLAASVSDAEYAEVVYLRELWRVEYNDTKSDEALVKWNEWGREADRMLHIRQAAKAVQP